MMRMMPAQIRPTRASKRPTNAIAVAVAMVVAELVSGMRDSKRSTKGADERSTVVKCCRSVALPPNRFAAIIETSARTK